MSSKTPSSTKDLDEIAEFVADSANDGATEHDERHPVDILADEFAAKINDGEQPSIDDYAARYPEHAALIRSVFPSLELVRRVSARVDQHRSNDSSNIAKSIRDASPELIGDFQIVREIGRGGMGVVYEALQLSLKRHVALKIIGTTSPGNLKHQARFRREAEAAASLHHTNIVPVFGIGEEQGLLFYAMQLIDGVTLSEVIHALRGTIATRPSTKPLHEDTVDNLETHTDESNQSRIHFHSDQAVRLLLQNELGASSPLFESYSLAPQDSKVTTRSAENDLQPDNTSISNTPADITRRRLSNEAGSGEISAEKGSVRTAKSDAIVQSADSVSLNPTYFRNVARIVSNMAGALDYAHRQGVLHRDIKPSNLLIDREGIVWITDFGLARRIDTDGMTQTGEIVGTLRYMSPEQLTGSADARTDIFSLGLTLFELLTLQPAIQQPSTRWHQTGAFESISRFHAIAPKVPRDLQTITLKACEIEPSRRYQSAIELEDDLRRFIEDRPILARRSSLRERLQRWIRRNPAVAGLSAATFGLLLTVATLLAIGIQRKQQTLDRVNREFSRAEFNLHEKTLALARVEREQSRAELNLDLAMQAFETVVSNIAGRGRFDTSMGDADNASDFLLQAGATLSQADVVLMETLLGFFDRFSEENSKDLSDKAALARWRMGDIQQQLGRLVEAEESYRLALQTFQTLAEEQSEQQTWVFAQANILNELLAIAIKRGEMPKAFQHYKESRHILEQSDSIRQSSEGRFALAQTLNTMASVSSRFNRDPRSRPRGIPGLRLPLNKNFEGNSIGDENTAASFAKSRFLQEIAANQEALGLLNELTKESPDNLSYQVALARSLKDQVRISRMTNDWKKAEKSLSIAIGIFEKLCFDHPESDAFKYELADTLGISMTAKPSDLPRLLRSMKLSDELIAASPQVAEYRSLQGQTLNRLAALQFASGRKDRGEESLRRAIEVIRKLADQYPDVLAYQYNLVQSLQQIAEMHLAMKRPDLAREDLSTAIERLKNFRGQSRPWTAVEPLIERLRERQQAIATD